MVTVISSLLTSGSNIDMRLLALGPGFGKPPETSSRFMLLSSRVIVPVAPVQVSLTFTEPPLAVGIV